jgi:hypothetical protein
VLVSTEIDDEPLVAVARNQSHERRFVERSDEPQTDTECTDLAAVIHVNRETVGILGHSSVDVTRRSYDRRGERAAR